MQSSCRCLSEGEQQKRCLLGLLKDVKPPLLLFLRGCGPHLCEAHGERQGQVCTTVTAVLQSNLMLL